MRWFILLHPRRFRQPASANLNLVSTFRSSPRLSYTEMESSINNRRAVEAEAKNIPVRLTYMTHLHTRVLNLEPSEMENGIINFPPSPPNNHWKSWEPFLFQLSTNASLHWQFCPTFFRRPGRAARRRNFFASTKSTLIKMSRSVCNCIRQSWGRSTADGVWMREHDELLGKQHERKWGVNGSRASDEWLSTHGETTPFFLGRVMEILGWCTKKC